MSHPIIENRPSTTAGVAAQREGDTPSATDSRPIVFFDGVCGLCNHLVDFILKRDSRGRILLAPLQGETAKQRLSAQDQQQVSTIVMLRGGREFRRSAAIVRILWELGGVWSWLGSLLWIVPLPLRDLGYRLIAGSRYKLFGKRETCRLPTPEEQGRLLP
jgi:predicted DCC family thiol-disulfide oxidoreductase YuxK